MRPTTATTSRDVSLDGEVLARHPDLRIALLTARAGAYPTDDAAREAESTLLSRLRTALPDGKDVRRRPEDELYRAFYRSMGLKAAQVSTPVKQATRVLRTGTYVSRGPVVDVAMDIEYRTLVSFQAYDADQLPDPLRFAIAKGGEPIATMRGDDKLCKPGELVLVAGGRVVHSCYYGNDRRFALHRDSATALVRVMGVPGLSFDSFSAAVIEARDRLEAVDAVWLSADAPSGNVRWTQAREEVA